MAGAGQVVVPRQAHRRHQQHRPHGDGPAQGGENVPGVQVVVLPVLLKEAVVGDEQQAEEGQGQQLGRLDPPEDALMIAGFELLLRLYRVLAGKFGGAERK